MKQKSTSMIAVLSVVFLGLLTGVTGQLLGQGGTVVSKFGQAQVAGRTVIVHVTVVVPAGANANQVALDALRNQGARPFQGDEFSTSGLVWDEFSDTDLGNDMVFQNYNYANDPTQNGYDTLLSTHDTWTGVSTSAFAFADGGVTTRCPSLVKECRGPQTLDGFNDVGWLRIGGCCTLAVTWFSTSVDEADMALNTNFSWSPESGGFDAKTVMLHENGHVAGLGHSKVEEAVMFATYSVPRVILDADDEDGIIYLYPLYPGAISGKVTDGENAISEATVTVNTQFSATTDDEGDYTIDQIPEGTYNVIASALGFTSETELVTVVAWSTTNVPDISLTPTDESPPEDPAGDTVSVESINYATEAGKNNDKHLLITVVLDQTVAGASVSIDLARDEALFVSGTGTTLTSGTVTFTLKNAASGCYVTTVTDVIVDGLTWNNTTPSNELCK